MQIKIISLENAHVNQFHKYITIERIENVIDESLTDGQSPPHPGDRVR